MRARGTPSKESFLLGNFYGKEMSMYKSKLCALLVMLLVCSSVQAGHKKSVNAALFSKGVIKEGRMISRSPRKSNTRNVKSRIRGSSTSCPKKSGALALLVLVGCFLVTQVSAASVAGEL